MSTSASATASTAADQVVDAVGVDRHAEPQLGLDLVALGDRDVAHVVAEPGQPQRAQLRASGGGPRPRPDPLGHRGIADVPGDGLAGHAEPGLDVAELPVAVRRLVEVHEVHVDRSSTAASTLACVCRCSSGVRSASSPAIHIFAGENVCIHAITPTHASEVLASRQTRRIALGVGQHRLPDHPDGHAGGVVSGIGDLPRLLGDLAQRVLAVQCPGCR